MSYKEKRIIVLTITGLFILIAYCIYAYGKYNSGTIAVDDIRFWAGTILIFIGIGIVSAIIIQIIFHILLSVAIAMQQTSRNAGCDDKKIGKTIEAEMVMDEMDRLIELKAMRIGFITAGTGFVAALVSIVLGFSPVIMINIMFISICVGSLFEGFTQLYFYRRGVKSA